MNKLVCGALSAFFLITASVFGQELEGTFRNSTGYILLEGGKITFDIDEAGSPMNNKAGSGSYRQVGDFFVVKTEPYTGKRSEAIPTPASKKDTIVIQVVNSHNAPIQGVLVETLSESGKKLLGGVTNGNGRILFLHNPKIAKIRVFDMGADNLAFAYRPRNDFRVILAGKTVVENRTAVFKISPIDEESVSFLFLSSDFDAGKDEQKALDKLLKQAQKRNFLEKRLKKEYSSDY